MTWSGIEPGWCAQQAFRTPDPDGRLVIPSAAPLRPAITNAFSIGAWVRGFDPLIFSSAEGAFPTGVRIWKDQWFYRNNGGDLRKSMGGQPDRVIPGWNLVMWTYDGSNTPGGVRLYRNGIERGGVPVIANTTPNGNVGTGDVMLGAGFTGSVFQAGTGYYKHVLFFEYELTAADNLELFRHPEDPRNATLSGAGPYGFWPLDEQNKFTDFGSGGNNITSAPDYQAYLTPYARLMTDARLTNIIT